MAKRVGVASIIQETNTFSAIRAQCKILNFKGSGLALMSLQNLKD
jgi:microcystin degradation protein MlrC